MKLRSIETTPSPNCIKLNLDEPIVAKPLTLQRESDAATAPIVAQALFAIPGVQSVFLMSDFIALTRKPQANWQSILTEAACAIGVADDAESSVSEHLGSKTQTSTIEPTPDFGQVDVAVQTFREIPVQVRATSADGQQARVSLPERFNEALQRAIAATGANYIAERRWQPYQPQFGNPDEVASIVAEEIVSLIDDTELARLEQAAIAAQSNAKPAIREATPERLQDQVADLTSSDWKRRLKTIQQITVTPETFAIVVRALEDEHSSVRRWAAAILGSSAMAEAVEPLCRCVLTDRSVMVRRTAADALSDLGNEGAIETMCQVLQDSSPLVRWRAARFLKELGDRTTLDALQQAVDQETEFDVKVELSAALDRIQGGGDTQLPMWMRLAGNIKE